MLDVVLVSDSGTRYPFYNLRMARMGRVEQGKPLGFLMSGLVVRAVQGGEVILAHDPGGGAGSAA